MLIMLFQLLLRLAFALVHLATQIALGLATLAGRGIGALLGAAWRRWRNRSAHAIDRRAADPQPPPAPEATTPPRFTPRPLRPRPRR